jgi:hypothetical protein
MENSTTPLEVKAVVVSTDANLSKSEEEVKDAKAAPTVKKSALSNHIPGGVTDLVLLTMHQSVSPELYAKVSIAQVCARITNITMDHL